MVQHDFVDTDFDESEQVKRTGETAPAQRTPKIRAHSDLVAQFPERVVLYLMEEHTGNDPSLRFVPEMLVEYINKRNEKELEPASFFVHGVCLLVDISGFTKLSGEYCAQGKSGIDSLQLATNGFMGKLVEIIYSFGGDIIKFAGDAIICVFSSDFITNVSSNALRRSACGFESFRADLKDLSKSSFDLDPKSVKTSKVSTEVILRVMHCAKVLREVQTDKLTVHVAMSCGEMCFGVLGGFENRWECLISGPCIHQLSGCLDDAPSKHAVMSAGCVEVLVAASVASAEPFTEVKKGKSTLLTSLIRTNAGMYVFEILPLESGNYRIVDVQCASTMDALSTAINKASAKIKTNALSHVKLIQQFVPVPIAEELESAKELNLMAEIREVTTMFMKWDSYDSTESNRNLITLQPCFFEAQRILQETGAYLRQFLVDDKGCVLIACWGMPHLSYLDNAHRGLSAAVQIRQELFKLDMNCSFGITTGDVYCGTVGSALRMEYAAIGSVVNMSARLMAKANGGILIDDATFFRLKLSARAILNAIDPLQVKGRAEPLKVYQYNGSGSLSQAGEAVGDHQISFECHKHLFGMIQKMAGVTFLPRRRTSMQLLTSLSTAAAGGGPSSTSSRSPWFSWIGARPVVPGSGTTLPLYVLQGRPGSGRTSVCSWLKSQAAEFTLLVCSVRLNKKDTQFEYIVWKKMFLQLMPKDLFSSNHVQRNYVNNLLRSVYGNHARLARTQGYPVLRAVLGITCDFADVPQRENSQTGAGSSWRVSSYSFQPLRSIKSKPSGSHRPQPLQVLDTLVRIFTHLLSLQATVLIIENIELADEESLILLLELTKISTRCAVVCTALAEATVDDSCSPPKKSSASLSKFNNSTEYKSNAFNSTPWRKHFKDLILAHKTTTLINLENYTPEEIDKMLSVALGVRVVPPEISQIVQDFSGGSYFWVREILQFIKEHGPEVFMSAVGENEKEVDKPPPRPGTAGAMMRAPSARMITRAPSFKQLSQRKLNIAAPHQQQLDKLVLTRFGNMSTENQRLLRTASIIGMNFNSEVLQGVLPTHLKAQQAECIQILLHQKWIYPDGDLEYVYQFAHSHTHHIIYELTPSSERSNLHQLIADYIEVTYPDDRTQYAPLCFHYQHCDTDKALQYAVKATAVMLETDDIFDFGDLLDLLTGLFECCCYSYYDVEILQRLVNQARSTIEDFDVSVKVEQGSRTCVSVLRNILSVCRCTAPRESYVVAPSSLPLSRTKSLLSLSVYKIPSTANFNLGELRDEDEIREMNHETDGGDINYEARTKRLLLLQIKTFRNQLSQRYVDLREDSGSTAVAKEWQKEYLVGKN